MLSTKDLVLTQCNRTAFYYDISARGREFDSRVEIVGATLPTRLLKRVDRHLILLASFRCKPHMKLPRTCRGNTDRHLAC